mgnify:CR=1 FL=1
MKRVWETCKPHPEILGGTATEESFVANLGAIWEKLDLNKDIEVDKRYLDINYMLNRTYYTYEMKRILKSISRRLNGDEKAQSIYHIEVGFGGGKTHTLVLIYHLAKNALTITIKDEKGETNIKFPKTKIVVIDGQLPDAYGYTFPDGTCTNTLWGLLFKQLGAYDKLRDKDSWDNMPGVDTIRETIKETPVLILIDEIVSYMNKIKNQLWDKVATFINDLMRAVTETKGAALIITTPTGVEVFEAAADHVRKITNRYTMPITITRAEETGEIRKRALFEQVEIDEDVIINYQSLYSKLKERLSGRILALASGETLKEKYPFHPSVDDTLYKLKESEYFQAVRDELRFLAGLTYGIFKTKPEDCYIISISDADLDDSYVRGGITKVAGPRLDKLITEDLDTISKIEDESIRQLAKRVHATIVLNSLEAPPGELGIKKEELIFSTIRPDMLYESIELALDHILRLCNVGIRDERYIFGTISLDKLINMYLKRVEKEGENLCWQKIENSLESYRHELKSGKIFRKADIIIWPAATNYVADDKEIKLILVDYSQNTASSAKDALEIAKEFLEKYGESFRRYKNTVFVLVADRELVKNAASVAKRLIALEMIISEEEQIREKYGEDIIRRVKAEKSRLEKDISPIAFQAYKYLIYPGGDPIELGLDTYRIRDLLLIVEENLKGCKKIIETANIDFFIKSYWPKGKSNHSVKDLISEVYERPETPLIPNELSIETIIKDAVKEGYLVYVYKNDIYWKREPLHLNRDGILWLPDEAKKNLRLELKITVEPEEITNLNLITPQPGTYSYTLGQEAIIVATDSAEWIFKHWIIDGRTETARNLKLTMDRYYQVTAIYEKLKVTPKEVEVLIDVEPKDAGIIEPKMGITKVKVGELLSLTAKPKAGWTFSYWKFNDNRISDDPELLFKIEESGSLIAVMQKEKIKEIIELEEIPFTHLLHEITPYRDKYAKKIEVELTCDARDLLLLSRHLGNILKLAVEGAITISSRSENIEGMETVNIEAKTASIDALRNFITQILTYLGDIKLTLKAELKEEKAIYELITNEMLNAFKKRKGTVEKMIIEG